MSHKQWPYQEAEKLIKKIKSQGRETVVMETGYGPSGLPHIGTFGEVARTSYVATALKTLAPELKVRLITFSDDMDGLRSPPENVPNHDMLLKNLGKPLNNIPDPFGEKESYAAYMNARLQEFLDAFGFEYEFTSSTDCYRAGRFNEGLKRVMARHEEVIKIFTAGISAEKAATWSPFFPTCENCGKIYTTIVTQHHPASNQVSYACADVSNPRVKPCGHEGRVSILDGKAKVGWKIDWALRWFSLGIDYEMYGKDLMDSYSISSKVVRLLGGKAPITLKYELFLDEEGHKISKKIGNGVSMDQWLAYAPTEVLLHFMYAKPNQAKRMGLGLIPRQIDEYLRLLKGFNDNEDSPVFFIKHADIMAQKLEKPAANIDYALLLNLVHALGVSDEQVILDYLTGYDQQAADNIDFFRNLTRHAIRYDQEVLKPAATTVSIDHSLDGVLAEFTSKLSDMHQEGQADPETVQTLAFECARSHEIEVKSWFKHLYNVLLNQDSGPKVGSFICLFGVEASLEKLDKYLKQQDK